MSLFSSVQICSGLSAIKEILLWVGTMEGWTEDDDDDDSAVENPPLPLPSFGRGS